MVDVAISINKVPIRMTKERWSHISVGHPEIAPYYDVILETIETPENVYLGNYDEYIAIKKTGDDKDKFIVVIYKETGSNDGFIITSFITNKKSYFERKKLIWKQ